MTATLPYAFEEGGRRWPLYPVLMPAAWERPPQTIVSPLVRGARCAVPLLATAHVVGEPGAPATRRVFLRDDALAAAGVAVEVQLAAAFRNLRQRRGAWHVVAPGIVAASDDYFAAEKILLPAYLCAAAARLHAREGLVVCAPERGMLMATSYEACRREPAHAHGLSWASADTFRRSRDPISPLLFRISTEGRIAGVLEVG